MKRKTILIVLAIATIILAFCLFNIEGAYKTDNDNPYQADSGNYDNPYYIIRSPKDNVNKYGYINSKGKIVIPPKFSSVLDFSDGLAAVEYEGKWGDINKNNQFIVKPQYEEASSFYEGLSVVFIDGKYGYIDKKGNMTINNQFDVAANFSEGLARVGVKTNIIDEYSFEYIDQTGQCILKPISGMTFDGDFHEGLAKYKVTDKNGAVRYGFIDAKGKIAIQAVFEHCQDFSEGLAAVCINNNWGYINKKGKLVIKHQFGNAEEFVDGLAVISLPGDNKYKFIDKIGKVVLDHNYKEALNFSEGLAMVRINTRCGYINKNGKLIIKPTYVWGYDFIGGIAYVRIGNMYQYIDKKGKVIWQRKLTDLEQHRDPIQIYDYQPVNTIM